jgi:hypothetical protein
MVRIDSAAPWSMLTEACRARGLIITQSAPLGGLTLSRLCVQKLTLKTCEFVDISNTLASDATIPTTLMDLQQFHL